MVHHHQVGSVGGGCVHEVQLMAVVCAACRMFYLVTEGVVSFAAGGDCPTEGSMVIVDRLAVHAASARPLARQHIPLAFLRELAAHRGHTVHKREGLLHGCHHAPLATLLSTLTLALVELRHQNLLLLLIHRGLLLIAAFLHDS